MPSRRTVLLAAGSAGVLALAGCSPASSTPSADAGSPTGPVTVTLWHSAAGPVAAALAVPVTRFNNENKGRTTVQAAFQGSYADAQNKYIAAVQSQSTPSLLAINDIFTGFMVDSKQTVPIYQFTAADSSFDAGDVPAAGMRYYGSDKGLLAMPFAISQPELYLNPVIVRQAGLNPATPPSTFSELARWAQQIKDRTGKHGFGMNLVDSWMLEELTASGGHLLCTPENGRAADRVRGISMTSEDQIAFLTQLQKLFADGVAFNPGTNTANLVSAFTSGQVGMIINSSGSYTSLKPTPQSQVVVAPFPKTSGSPDAGVAIGGAALWVQGPGHGQAEQQAAYHFAKFMQSGASQALWAKATGYLAASTAATSLPDGKAALADPNVAVMYKQLKGTPDSNAATGCRSGAYAAIRKTLIDAFNEILGGSDVRTAMGRAEEQAKTQISRYDTSAK